MLAVIITTVIDNDGDDDKDNSDGEDDDNNNNTQETRLFCIACFHHFPSHNSNEKKYIITLFIEATTIVKLKYVTRI